MSYDEERVFERRRQRVYLAGPISQGDPWENVVNGIRWGRRMLEDGLAPYVPHLDAYLTLGVRVQPNDPTTRWNALMEWDLEWVATSEALFRLNGPSKGADLEIAVADSLEIPVFWEHEYGALLEWADMSGLRGKRVWS